MFVTGARQAIAKGLRANTALRVLKTGFHKFGACQTVPANGSGLPDAIWTWMHRQELRFQLRLLLWCNCAASLSWGSRTLQMILWMRQAVIPRWALEWARISNCNLVVSCTLQVQAVFEQAIRSNWIPRTVGKCEIHVEWPPIKDRVPPVPPESVQKLVRNVRSW